MRAVQVCLLSGKQNHSPYLTSVCGKEEERYSDFGKQAQDT